MFDQILSHFLRRLLHVGKNSRWKPEFFTACEIQLPTRLRSNLDGSRMPPLINHRTTCSQSWNGIATCGRELLSGICSHQKNDNRSKWGKHFLTNIRPSAKGEAIQIRRIYCLLLPNFLHVANGKKLIWPSSSVLTPFDSTLRKIGFPHWPVRTIALRFSSSDFSNFFLEKSACF